VDESATGSVNFFALRSESASADSDRAPSKTLASQAALLAAESY